MRLAVVVAIVEAALLVGLAFARFEAAKHLPRSLEPPADPLVSNLGWIEIALWLAAPPLIGVLVARSSGRVMPAALLAFGAVASAVVASPLLQLAVSGWPLQTPPDLLFFAPPGGWSRDYAVLFLMVIGVPIAGGIAAVEAALAAALARRLAPLATLPPAGPAERPTQ